MNGKDSKLITFVREGETVLARLQREFGVRRVAGVVCLALAAFLFIPSRFLIPGLVFAGFGLLGFSPFGFGACGGDARRAGVAGGSSEEGRA